MRVDYKELEKEIEKLKAKRSECMRSGKVAQAFAIDNDLKKVEDKMKWMVEHEKERFSTLLADLPLDEQRRWSRNCMLMLMLADLLNSVTTDVNGQLLSITGMYLSTMELVSRIKFYSDKLAHVFNRDSESDEMRHEWHELSDQTLLYIQNMANAYMHKKEVKDAKEALKAKEKDTETNN